MGLRLKTCRRISKSSQPQLAVDADSVCTIECEPIGLSMPCSHLKSGYMRVIMSMSSTACPHAAFTSGHFTSSFQRPSRNPLIVPNLSRNLHTTMPGAHTHAQGNHAGCTYLAACRPHVRQPLGCAGHTSELRSHPHRLQPVTRSSHMQHASTRCTHASPQDAHIVPDCTGAASLTCPASTSTETQACCRPCL